jgi:hypothetical protein
MYIIWNKEMLHSFAINYFESCQVLLILLFFLVLSPTVHVVILTTNIQFLDGE